MKPIPLFFGAIILAAAAPGLGAQAPLRACTLMTKAEVKQHLPWPAMLDQFPVEEEALGRARGCLACRPASMVRSTP